MSLNHVTIFLIFSLFITLSYTTSCRDRTKWPFSSSSIWNTPIGSRAVYSPANIFHTSTPSSFASHVNYFISSSSSDPKTPFYYQSISSNDVCELSGSPDDSYNFPSSFVSKHNGNNPTGVLLPDKTSFIQLQNLVRCEVGGPVIGSKPKNISITGEGIKGGHLGSGLSSIGGTIRLGELLPTSPPLHHALKLELSAHTFYYQNSPCFTWPATNCDSYHNENSTVRYGGNNPGLVPGALLAIPPSKQPTVRSIPGKKILYALTYYGGYLVDDAKSNNGVLCTENGVTDEFMKFYGYSFDTTNGVFYYDMLAIFKALMIVSSNGPNNVGGGGVPLQSLAPPMC